jgi:hypothetical protein
VQARRNNASSQCILRDIDNASGIQVAGTGRRLSRGVGSYKAASYLQDQGGQGEEDQGARGDSVGNNMDTVWVWQHLSLAKTQQLSLQVYSWSHRKKSASPLKETNEGETSTLKFHRKKARRHTSRANRAFIGPLHPAYPSSTTIACF